MSKKQTPADKLRKARGFIEQGWCQGNSALDERGNKVPALSAKAVKFCMWGALGRATRNEKDWIDIENYMRRATGITDMPEFNDSRKSVKPILKAFDKAIKYAEKNDKSATGVLG